MSLRAFRRTVVATVLEDAAVVVTDDVRRDVQGFVSDGIGAMSPHLRLGVFGLEAMLAAATLARNGKPFARLDTSQRLAHVRSWEASPFAPANQYVRLIRSLVLFAAHEGARV